uniref:Uncharacterized protein n=1 Tax=Dromaius novaehollandiae TaxID=8790 RepID=A0A8C4KEL7_DRONO
SSAGPGCGCPSPPWGIATTSPVSMNTNPPTGGREKLFSPKPTSVKRSESLKKC